MMDLITHPLTGVFLIGVLVIAALIIVLREKEFPVEYHAYQDSGSIKYEVGTIIVCPGCGIDIAVAVKDVYCHSQVKSSDWSGEGIKPCEPMLCPKCKTPYIKSNAVGGLQLHTKEGWR